MDLRTAQNIEKLLFTANRRPCQWITVIDALFKISYKAHQENNEIVFNRMLHLINRAEYEYIKSLDNKTH